VRNLSIVEFVLDGLVHYRACVHLLGRMVSLIMGMHIYLDELFAAKDMIGIGSWDETY